MTQEECIKLLEKENRWMTNKEISKKLRIVSANENLAKLFKYGEVQRRIKKGNIYEWRCLKSKKKKSK